MAINQAMRQKKRARQNKREQKNSFSGLLSGARELAVAMQSPIHECFFTPEEMKSSGIGQIFISRKMSDGRMASSMFMLDIFCLGVKDTFYTITDPYKYREMIENITERFNIEHFHPTCAKKLIEGGIEYARKIGFQPHSEYQVSSLLIKDVDSSLCQNDFEYGHNGKPFYIAGPNDDQYKVQRVINQLMKSCGESNFNYMIGDPLDSDLL